MAFFVEVVSLEKFAVLLPQPPERGFVLKLISLFLLAAGMSLVPSLHAQSASLDAAGRLVSEDGFVLMGQDTKGNLMYAKKVKKQDGGLRRALVKWEYVDGRERFDHTFWDCKGGRYRFPNSEKWSKNNPSKMYDYVFQFVCK